MRIIVTGGAGFIGSNFIHYIIDKQEVDLIINYDALTYAGNLNNLTTLEKNQKYRFIQGNLTNFELLDFVCKKYEIDHIVNFAAESHVDRSISNPNIFIESNVQGTLTLLNVARKNNTTKYLQISTDEVYGSLDFHDPAFTENNPITPRSPYSASKASADMLVLSYFHTFGFPAIITRCSNNYGPFQFPEKLIPLMINNLKNSLKLPIYGDGKNVRDWIHVLDHCSGIWAALTEGKIGEVYNFGGNAEKSNIELVRTLIQLMNKSEDSIEYVKDRPGHDLRYAMNYSKAHKELKWSPSYSFENGIKETVEWYLENENWLQNVTSGKYLQYYRDQYENRR